MKKFKVLTILLFVFVIANFVIDKSVVLLPINNGFVEHFIKKVPVICRVEPKSELEKMPVITVGDVNVESMPTKAELSVMTEYSGCSVLWLDLTARNRLELNQMAIFNWSVWAIAFVISIFIGVYILILVCKILWGFTKEKIFTERQSKRIGQIVFLLITSDVLDNIYTFVVHYYNASKLTLSGWDFVMPNLYISGVIIALILWLFNEILKQTILLKEEQSLTI